MATPYLDEAERCARVALAARRTICSPSTPRTLRQRSRRADGGGRDADTSRPAARDASRRCPASKMFRLWRASPRSTSGSGAGHEPTSIRSGLEQRWHPGDVGPAGRRLARGRVHRSHYAEGGRTEVSPSMPTRRGTTAVASTPILVGLALGLHPVGRGRNTDGDAHPGGRHCQRIGEQPTHWRSSRRGRSAATAKRGPRARRIVCPDLGAERRLHAHQPRYTVLRSRSRARRQVIYPGRS